MFLYAAFGLAIFFVLNKTTLQPANAAPLSLPPKVPATPGTPAATSQNADMGGSDFGVADPSEW